MRQLGNTAGGAKGNDVRAYADHMFAHNAFHCFQVEVACTAIGGGRWNSLVMSVLADSASG